MKTVAVDFSTTHRGGLVRASLRKASQQLRLGDEVLAIDSAEAMEFIGVVEQMSDDGRFAYLRMQWNDSEMPPLSLAAVVIGSWSEAPGAPGGEFLSAGNISTSVTVAEQVGTDASRSSILANA